VSKLFENKGGNLFIYVSYYQGRALYYLLKVNKHWHGRKGWEKESNTVKGARSIYLRNPWVRFKSYKTRTSLIRYDLNLTLWCHIFYDLAPLPVLDPIWPYIHPSARPSLLGIILFCYWYVYHLSIFTGKFHGFLEFQGLNIYMMDLCEIFMNN
jgi:hypothetical protein